MKKVLIGVKMVCNPFPRELCYTSPNTMLDSDEPEWIIEQTRARKRREMLRQREEMETRLAKVRAKEKAQRDRYLNGDQNFKKRKTTKETTENDHDEDQFFLDDYDSDHEEQGLKNDGDSLYSAATLELMSKLGMGPSALKEDDEEVEDETKVYISLASVSQHI